MSEQLPLWDAGEDEFLMKHFGKGIPPLVIARRLGRTEQECRDRHAHLTALAAAAKAQAAAIPKPVEPASAAERPMDALQMVLLDFCKKYNELGQQLEIFSTFISQSVSWEDLQKQVAEVEAFRRQCVNPLPAHEFLALQLHQRYILVPRPLLVPKEPEPATDDKWEHDDLDMIPDDKP